MKNVFFVTGSLSSKLIDLFDFRTKKYDYTVYSFEEYAVGDIAYTRGRGRATKTSEVLEDTKLCIVDCQSYSPSSQQILRLSNLGIPLLFACQRDTSIHFSMGQLLNSRVIYTNLWDEIRNSESHFNLFVDSFLSEEHELVTLESPSESNLITLANQWDCFLEKFRTDHALIHQINHRDFEELIAELLSRENFDVELTQAKRDGGRDILARMNGPLGNHIHLVECKHYAPGNRVGVSYVRNLYGVFSQSRANSAMLITTSSFTKPAHEFTVPVSHHLTLRDGSYLHQWIRSLDKYK